MTALRPFPDWDVTPVEPNEERKLLRKVLTNPVCGHPDCDKPTESVHHLVPRGTLNSSSWFIRIPGVDKPVLHAIGLCGSGTTGHHGDLEEHRGWVKLEGDTWNWYEQTTYSCEFQEDEDSDGNAVYLYIDEFGDQIAVDVEDPSVVGLAIMEDDTEEIIISDWVLVGSLDPQPGKPAGKARKSKKLKGEVRPYRAQWNVGVPKDERENGADVLDELEQAVREKYQEEMGWSDSAPRYHVIVACLVKSLQ